MSMKTRGAVVTVALLVTVGGSAAGAVGRAPAPVAPKSGATVPRGGQLVFRARSSVSGTIILAVSRSRSRRSDGTIASDQYLRTMTPRGAGVYEKRADSYPHLKNYFLNRPGTYYWQTYRINCAEEHKKSPSDCAVASAQIRSFTVRDG